VGYGRPPLHSRIQPGQKLNPKGRPRGSKNTATLITEEFDKKFSIREGKGFIKCSKREAAIRNLCTKAAVGDYKILMALVALEGGSGAQPGTPAEGPPLTEKDRANWEHVLQDVAASLSINAPPVKREKAE
jgi:hypothetical protein